MLCTGLLLADIHAEILILQPLYGYFLSTRGITLFQALSVSSEFKMCYPIRITLESEINACNSLHAQGRALYSPWSPL